MKSDIVTDNVSGSLVKVRNSRGAGAYRDVTSLLLSVAAHDHRSIKTRSSLMCENALTCFTVAIKSGVSWSQDFECLADGISA